jgi:hypothetical protein
MRVMVALKIRPAAFVNDWTLLQQRCRKKWLTMSSRSRAGRPAPPMPPRFDCLVAPPVQRARGIRPFAA